MSQHDSKVVASLTRSCALAAAIVFSPIASSQEPYPKGLFAINQLHFDAVRAPQGLNWYLQSREAKAIIAAASTYMGINPRYVVLAVNSLPSARKNGEETNYELPPPEGYKYCSSRIGVTSMVPAEGDRASSISASVFPGGSVRIYTWTPVRHYGEGRSWVEGDVQITGILPKYHREFVSKGICADVSAQVGLLECKGNPCEPGRHGGSGKGEVARKEPKLIEGV